MRYIKLFEDLGSDLYEVISRDDFYVDDVLKFDTEPFTEKEKQVLYSYGFIDDPYPVGGAICKQVRVKYHLAKLIHIYKSNDSWYYISFLKYYKCDQWDGLMNCLKNEFNIE